MVSDVCSVRVTKVKRARALVSFACGLCQTSCVILVAIVDGFIRNCRTGRPASNLG